MSSEPKLERMILVGPPSHTMIEAGYDAMRDENGLPPDHWVLGHALKVFVAMIDAGIKEGRIETTMASPAALGEAIVTDAARLDFLQAAALKSPTGISIDYVPEAAGLSSGWRLWRQAYQQEPATSLRAAIDAACRNPDVAR